MALAHLGNEISNTINSIDEESAQISKSAYESISEFISDPLDRLDSQVNEFSSDIEDYISEVFDRVKYAEDGRSTFIVLLRAVV